MAFTSVLDNDPEFMGRKKQYRATFNSAGVTTGAITFPVTEITTIIFENQTGIRAGSKATASGGVVTLAGLTAGDIGVITIQGN